MPSKSNIRKFYQQLFERYGTAQVGDVIKSDEKAQCEEFDTTKVRIYQVNFNAYKLTELKSSAIAILYSKLEIRFGLLRRIAPRFSSRYTYQLLRESLGEEDTSDLAQTVIKMSKEIKKPRDAELLSIDIDEVANALEIDRSQVMSKLREWNDSKIIDLGSPDGISRYRVIKQFPQTQLAVQEVIETIYNELKAQDAETIERTRKVIKLITGKSCYARGLAAHFEDIGSVPEKGCGHCQWCLTKKRVRLWEDKFKSKNKGRPDAERINTVLAACPDRNDPELLAKIAFGVKSPKILREGYGPRNEVFGSMRDCNFDVCSPISFHIDWSLHFVLCRVISTSSLLALMLITAFSEDYRTLLINSKPSATTTMTMTMAMAMTISMSMTMMTMTISARSP